MGTDTIETMKGLKYSLFTYLFIPFWILYIPAYFLILLTDPNFSIDMEAELSMRTVVMLVGLTACGILGPIACIVASIIRFVRGRREFGPVHESEVRLGLAAGAAFFVIGLGSIVPLAIIADASPGLWALGVTLLAIVLYLCIAAGRFCMSRPLLGNELKPLAFLPLADFFFYLWRYRVSRRMFMAEL